VSHENERTVIVPEDGVVGPAAVDDDESLLDALRRRLPL